MIWFTSLASCEMVVIEMFVCKIFEITLIQNIENRADGINGGGDVNNSNDVNQKCGDTVSSDRLKGKKRRLKRRRKSVGGIATRSEKECNDKGNVSDSKRKRKRRRRKGKKDDVSAAQVLRRSKRIAARNKKQRSVDAPPVPKLSFCQAKNCVILRLNW